MGVVSGVTGGTKIQVKCPETLRRTPGTRTGQGRGPLWKRGTGTPTGRVDRS